MDIEATSKSVHGRSLRLEIDLNYAQTIVGKRPVFLSIPILRMWPYSPAPGLADKYGPVRKWYRKSLQKVGGVFIVRRIDLERSLSKAAPDAVDYLVTWNEEERKKHEGWKEPGNEAVQIADWIFPANAVNMATVTPDFEYEKINVVVLKGGEAIAEVHYYVKPKEHTLYFLRFGKPRN